VEIRASALCSGEERGDAAMTATFSKPIPESPYRGIESFRFIDQQIFAARENETWELLSNLMIYRGVLLYGDSGTGKSSLINAGLVPEALKENLTPDVLRVQPRRGGEIKIERIPIEADGRPPYLASALATDDTSPTLECSITDVYRKLKHLKRSQPAEVRPLLIFDQFEEFVTLFEEASRGGTTEEAKLSQREARQSQQLILKALTRLIHDETLPIKILFVFREDYLAKLNPLFENCPNLLDQYVRLLPPHVDTLQQIIRAPFENQQLRDEFEKHQPGHRGTELIELAEKIAGELAHHSEGNRVNLSELQIVCLKLWQSANPVALFNEKSIQTLIGEYLSDALLKFPGELYQPAVALLDHMITGSGTRNIISEDDLLGRENLPEEILRKSLEALEDSKLVRKEPRHKIYFYEIVSEYLVPSIQRLKAARVTELERIKAQKNLGLARKRTRVLQKALAILSVLLVVAAGYLYVARQRARAHALELEAEQARAKELEQLNKRKADLQQPLSEISLRDFRNNLPEGQRKQAILMALELQTKRIPYKTGGRKPEDGLDLSGYIGYILSQPQIGIVKHLTLCNQPCLMNDSGITKASTLSELTTGDLIFYQYQHTMMYLGGGKCLGMIYLETIEVQGVDFLEAIGYGKVPYADDAFIRVEMADESQQDKASEIATQLRTKGYVLEVGNANGDSSIPATVTSVRYFGEPDKQEAMRILDILQKDLHISRSTVEPGKPIAKRRQYEIWFSRDAFR
jgi:hypothetical protein